MTETQHPSEPDHGPGSLVSVSPVIALSQTFSARPAAIPEAHSFVRTALASADVDPPPHAEVTDAINAALLTAASPEIGSFTVVVRLFPNEAEVEVLSSVAPSATSPVPGTGTFAAWLSDALRRQSLSQEAAARQLGVSVRTVSRWVRGQTEPRMRDLRRISDVFGLPP